MTAYRDASCRVCRRYFGRERRHLTPLLLDGSSKEIAIVLAEYPDGLSTAAVARSVRRRRADVLAALEAAEQAGLVERLPPAGQAHARYWRLRTPADEGSGTAREQRQTRGSAPADRDASDGRCEARGGLGVSAGGTLPLLVPEEALEVLSAMLAARPDLLDALAERVSERLAVREERGLVDEREAARLLGLSPRWLRERRRRGVVPYVRLGRRVLYRRADLCRFADERLV